MVKKMSVAPRAAQSTTKTDVVTYVSAEAVSQRAHSLFQARGNEHGHDVEDWLAAEAELLKGNHTDTQ
jgi:predicted metal-dependent hydrolase